MEMTLGNALLILAGCAAVSLAAVYGILRLGAWCDGREW